MILDKNVDVKINASNFNYYKKFFDNIKVGKIFTVSIEQLYKGTDTKINVKCDICGNEKSLSYKMYLKNYNKYNLYTCSRKCSQIKIEKTSQIRYGVDNPSKSEKIKEKIKETNNLRYGSDFTFQSEKIKDKIKKTNNIKYGVDYPQENENIFNKRKTTNLEKYGYITPSKNTEIKNKISKKLKKYWNNKLLNEFNIILISGDTYELYCDFCNEKYKINKYLLNNRKYFNTQLCTKCNKINNNSGYQNILLDEIKNIYDGEILVNNRKILNNEYEIDIFIPEFNIGIEFNGLYWHSNEYVNNEYHFNKYNKAKEKNIQLIQIWEDEWISNKNIIIENIIYRIYNKIYFDKNIIEIDNMCPYDIKNYEVVKIKKPNKFFVKNKIRYNIINNYDFIVYDAGSTIYKKNLI